MEDHTTGRPHGTMATDPSRERAVLPWLLSITKALLSVLRWVGLGAGRRWLLTDSECNLNAADKSPSPLSAYELRAPAAGGVSFARCVVAPSGPVGIRSSI